MKLSVMLVLIVEYWISGLFILSILFTQESGSHLNELNLYMFISVGVGSLLGGILSDYFNRITVFQCFSCVLFISCMIIIFSSEVGYIIGGMAIGPINTLTFVIIMQNFPTKSELFTSFVLMGWAFSQITLGVMFMFIQTSTFYYIIFGLSLLYFISTLLFIQKEQKTQQSKTSQITLELIDEQIDANNNKKQNKQMWLYRILPKSLKPLLGGCIFMFVMQMFYYRIQFTLGQFGISVQLNTIVVGCTQLLANIIWIQLVAYIPRKLIIRILIVCLMILYCVLILLDNQIIQTVIEGILRLSTTSIMITLGVYLPELFDYNERGKGTNYIMSFGVLGSALNGVVLDKLPLWVLQIFLITAFMSTFLLHETYKKKQRKQKREEVK